MLKMIFQRKKHATWIISVLCFGKFSQRHVWAYSFHPMRRFWWHARAHGVFLKSNARLQNLTLWWKFTIACRVEHIHRKPLKMNNYEYQTHHQTQFWSQATKTSRSSTGTATVRPRLKRWKKTTIFEFSWMYRITWLERYIKGSISSKGSLSETILVRKYEIFKSAS